MTHIHSIPRPRCFSDAIDLLPAGTLKNTGPQPDEAGRRQHDSGSTRFHPHRRGDDERPGTRPDATVEAPVVLVIDDEPSFQRLMDILLTTHRYAPLACSRAREAAAMARRHQPRIILLDLHMPRIDDGLRILEELRHDPQTQSIPVIMTSANPQGLERHAAELKSASVAQIVKPFDLEQLLSLIRQTLERPTDRADGPARREVTNPAPHDED